MNKTKNNQPAIDLVVAFEKPRTKRAFYLVLFFPVSLENVGAELVTKIHFDEQGNFSICYHRTYHIKAEPDPSEMLNCLLVYNNQQKIRFSLMKPLYPSERPPLCVDYYEYNADDKSVQLGSATMFCKNSSYQIIDFPILAKQRDKEVRGTVCFDSKLVLDPAIPAITLTELQRQFDELLQTKHHYSDSDFSHSTVGKIANTPMYMTTRVCARVCIKNFLKYIPIPVQLPPKLKEVITSSAPPLELKEFAKLCVNWLKRPEKGYSDDKHVLVGTEEEVKTDYWVSMLLQDVGNCKNMAITMYQLCKCYYKDDETNKWTFHLCSLILKDDAVPHAICVARRGEEEVFILDATRNSFPFDEDKAGLNKYLDEEYAFFVTLFSMDGVFNLVNNKTGKLGITPTEFINGDYDTQDKPKPKEDEALIAIAYGYQNNILA